MTRSIGPADDPYSPIIADFRVTMEQLKCAMSARVLRAGLSMAQLHILLRLHRSDGMTMSQLAEMMGVSLSNATGLVDRIEERGFVERRRVPEDRRVVRIQVTLAGAQLLEQVDALSDDLLRSVLERIARSELPAVGAAFAALRSALAGALGDEVAPTTDHAHPAVMRELPLRAAHGHVPGRPATTAPAE